MRTSFDEIAARILREGARRQFYTGACAAMARADGSCVEAFAGDTGTGKGEAVTPECLFDLASLTKPFVATIALYFVDQGTLGLEQTLKEILPAAAPHACGQCTVEELLCHESGLPAWLPLYEQVPRKVRGRASGARHLLELALSTPISHEQRGTVLYSDLGFVLLGAGLEALGGESLDTLVRNRIAVPLGLSTLSYRPLSLSRNNQATIVATEDCPWRGRLLVGQVHDDNAWAAGGVSGQAGLFGTAMEVARFGAAWMQWLKHDGLLSSDLAGRAVARRPSGRALAWDCRSDVGSSAGSQLGPRTFGHLGFTGCSLWIDPDLDVSIALLTNRVRLGRGNNALKAFRPSFYDAVTSNIRL